MKPIDRLTFSIRDKINELDVGPSNVPLSLIGEFQKDVAEFLKGSTRDVDPSKVIVTIENGSLSFTAAGLLTAVTLWSDIKLIYGTESIDSIDPKRAAVVDRWQMAAQRNPNRQYYVKDENSNLLFSIDSDSNLQKLGDIWVMVEKYIYGTVYDIGGHASANVHIRLENGDILPPIASTQSYLEKHGQDRLYRQSLVHITAEESLLTGALRNLSLIDFETHQPTFDEAEFDELVMKGTKAWADVEDHLEWIANIRGA